MTNGSAELTNALAKGLGRAHRILTSDPSSADITALLRACITDVGFDAQVEGSRAPYLYELVQLLSLGDRLAEELVSRLDDGDATDRTMDQRWELAGLLYRDGHADGLRGAMFDALRQRIDRWIADPQRVLPSTEPARQLILAAGSEGAVFAFAQLGRLTRASSGYWDDPYLVEEARSIASTGFDAMLEQARKSDPDVDAYLRAVGIDGADGASSEGGPARPKPPARRLEDLVWAEARQAIERQVRGTGQFGYGWNRWGKLAPDDELQAAALALVDLPREDLELLRPFLCIFGNRAFPLDPRPVVELLGDPREKVAWFAANALAQITHPMVRDAALRMATEGPLRERVVDLLAVNWQAGDEALVERLIREEEDVERLHSLMFHIPDVVKRQPGLPLVPTLLIAYERTPCSQCRGAFVKALIALDALPADLREECLWDAREETRVVVA